MANDVDPFVIRWPKKWTDDRELQDVLQYLNRFLHDLWIRTGGGDDFIDNTTTIISQESVIAGPLYAQIAKLQQRVEELESSDRSSAIERLVKLAHKRIDELIDELLAELKLQRPNEVQEKKKVVLLQENINELKLLNARIEEAYETGIEEGDT